MFDELAVDRRVLFAFPRNDDPGRRQIGADIHIDSGRRSDPASALGANTVAHHEKAGRVPPPRILRVKRFRDVFLGFVQARLDDLERLVLQRRIGPHQTAQITGRHATQMLAGAAVTKNPRGGEHVLFKFVVLGPTGTTDIPLTDNGRGLAERMRPKLSKLAFALVLVSPMQRARETCELAGLGEKAVIDNDLMEWNYGAYEGLTPSQIREISPGWLIFRDGCPGGETPEQVGARADRVIGRARALNGTLLCSRTDTCCACSWRVG